MQKYKKDCALRIKPTGKVHFRREKFSSVLMGAAGQVLLTDRENRVSSGGCDVSGGTCAG
ncbi:hypothetical protein HMPREF9141_2668 [Prevotella multiformis DSM 16608]|uniref:Uncharacterized protein n=1 Tax=Prevotella multiformis DSM 16608 TaxID=888743 RepID=F0FAQ1_9BACT|nr:hypothetical protein HMPREF9141_2668 [Prevotella multiformis DSM 16608]